MYLFDWPSPARAGSLGACHAIDLPFVFGNLDAPGMAAFAGAGPAAKALACGVMDAWAAFARSGDPSHDGLDPWPAYDAVRRATMRLGERCRVEDAPLENERALMEQLDCF